MEGRSSSGRVNGKHSPPESRAASSVVGNTRKVSTVNKDLSDARWFKSKHSDASTECVEVAFLDAGLVGVRDSKNPTAGGLVFGSCEWAAFTARVAGGKFDTR
ncbi:DUF397 domain-containing protein [Nocardia cyriacigeorgica]|uniref:DUF397 domain-containing protein n=1 Tax=Nocardia cyriacigeorgica TaxID=135487 RepID=UPI0034DAD020